MTFEDKTAAFVQFLTDISADDDVPRGVDFIEEVVFWSQQHLSGHNSHRGRIQGVRNGIRSLNETMPIRRPMHWFALRQYRTFLHAVIEYGNELYEFLPGAVYVYPILPMHLGTVQMPNLETLPEHLHIHYGPTAPEHAVYRQFIGRGWVDLSEHGTGRRGWHFPDDWTDLPAINGGAIRRIYSLFGQCVRQEYRNRGIATTVDLPGSRTVWLNATAQVGSYKQTAFLRTFRDGMRSYDPTHESIENMLREVLELTSGNLEPTTLMTRFKAAEAGMFDELVKDLA